ALDAATANLLEHLKRQTDADLADLADIAYTLQVGRREFEHRRALVCADREDAVRALEARDSGRALTAVCDGAERGLVFMFSGQGAQRLNMGRELYEAEPEFRAVVDECSEILRPLLGVDLRRALYADEETEEAARTLGQTWLTQPALFATEYALARLLESWGLKPAAMIGHSIGEYVAACVAGVLTLEDALRLVAARGRLMQSLPGGAMLSVALGEREAQALVGDELSLAALNAPARCVVSGAVAAIEALERRLAEREVSFRRLHTSHAFHSSMMEAALPAFVEELKRVRLSPPTLPYVSNVTGRWVTAEEATDPLYWARHLRGTVRFADGIRQLAQEPARVWLEVGPGDTLVTLAKQSGEKIEGRFAIPTLGARPGGPADEESLLGALGRLWLAGVRADWHGFYKHELRRRVSLPTYPFERERYWVAPSESFTLGGDAHAPVRAGDVADWFYVPSWERGLPPRRAEGAAATRWLVFVDERGLGERLVERLEREGGSVCSVVAGEEFAAVGERRYSVNPVRGGDYERLLAALRERGESPQRIVHLWSVAAEPATPEASDAGGGAALERGFFSLLRLAQSLGGQLLSSALGERKAEDDVHIVVVTDSAQEVTGDELLSPAQAAVLGPSTVIPQEYPGVTCRAVDILFGDGVRAAVLAEDLAREVASDAAESLVAYRGGHRWTQTFKSLRLDASGALPPRLRERGVYLITGGLGGVGLELADYLARTARARLVLTSRAALPERGLWDEWLAARGERDETSRRISRIRALEELGAEVLTVRADVADPEQMREALAQARERFGQVHGVIHAAGTVDGGMMQGKTVETAAGVLRPKVEGAFVLDRLFADAPLDFLVLCSSMRSYVGGAGTSDYTAANAFLDAFARRRNREREGLTVSVNWDGWRDVGMSVAAAEHARAQAGRQDGVTDEEGLTAAEGVEVFGRILGAALPQVVVSTRDFGAVLEENRKNTASHSLKVLEEASPSHPTHTRPQLGTPYVAPRSDAERTLTGIWQKLLGVEPVGVNDNFFELGGDSVVSIQLIAKAGAAGLRLTPKQVFEHQTVAEQAAEAVAAVTQAAPEATTGPLPLTPIQRRFFESGFSNPHHFNQSALLEVRKALDPARLERAVGHLLEHHDALRLRFTPGESGWRQAYGEPAGPTPFSFVDLSGTEADAQPRAVEQEAARAQTSLNLTSGPLVRVVLFDLGAGRPGRLLVVVHHAAVDAISWRILFEDLEDAYEQLTRGEEVRLAPKTASFKLWAERLAGRARTEEALAESAYWGAEERAGVEPLPLDFAGGVNDYASTETIEASLNEEETRALLQEVPAAFGTQINDALLTALWQAFASWMGGRALLVDMEGHGREALFDDVDVSRTIGWFTTVFPVLLDVRGALDAADALKSVKERLRAIPHHGIGYGLLRYLSGESETAERLRALPQAEVSFLYLGQTDQALAPASSFGPAPESAGPPFDAREARSYLLEISGGVAGGRLRTSWTYSRNVHRRETVERLAEQFLGALRSVVAVCRTRAGGLHTPSDYPEAGVSREVLDRLAAELGEEFDGRNVEDVHQLTPMQQGMLFHSLYAPESEAYFMQSSYLLRGELDAEALRRAWVQVLERHAVMRTGYVWEGLEQPLALVRRGAELAWAREDWGGLSEAERSRRLEEFLRSERRRGFDFARPPLMRLALIRAGEGEHYFVLTYHHVLMDGWSAFLVFKEVFDIYEALRAGREPGLEPTRPYRDYIAWLRRQPLAEAEAHWRRLLEGFREPISLRGERAPASADEQGEDFGSQYFSLSAEETAPLQSLAQRRRLTLNTLVQGAWGLLLSHYAGADDVVFGSVMSGRPPAVHGVEAIVGLFINTLPVRLRVSPETPLLDWLRGLQSQLLEARQYEYTPLIKIQSWSDVPRGVPLFESNLSFDNYPVDSSLSEQGAGLKVENTHSADWSAHPLSVAVGGGAELAVMLKYNRRRFDEEAMARMARHFRIILVRLASLEDATLGAALAALEEADRREREAKRKEFKESRLKSLRNLSRGPARQGS
ncbi:MAG: SDR family NAD(P)-dependent oxidoreductase, partial [Pyrinomonadaceae bacterium]